jgi:hypothetical protein
MNGMELSFTLGNLITLLIIIVPAIFGYANLQSKSKSNGDGLKSLEDKHKEDIIHIQNGKRAIKKDLMLLIKEGDDVAKQRIDKTQERMEKLNEKQNEVNVSINEKLNKILGWVEKQ